MAELAAHVGGRYQTARGFQFPIDLLLYPHRLYRCADAAAEDPLANAHPQEGVGEDGDEGL